METGRACSAELGELVVDEPRGAVPHVRRHHPEPGHATWPRLASRTRDVLRQSPHGVALPAESCRPSIAPRTGPATNPDDDAADGRLRPVLDRLTNRDTKHDHDRRERSPGRSARRHRGASSSHLFTRSCWSTATGPASSADAPTRSRSRYRTVIRSPSRPAEGPVASDSMGRNAPLLPRPRRGPRSKRAKTAASIPVQAGRAVPDDVATVYGWLCRLTAHPAETEDLLIEVIRRSRETAPTCVRAAPATTRLQFLTIQSVLRQRGVL